jgi:putative Mn2+ efflux pump MntP
MKNITISIFAIIGFVAIISGFTNQAEQTNQTTPESHVWELYRQTVHMHIY